MAPNRCYRAHRQPITQRQVVFDFINDRIYYHTRDNPRWGDIHRGRLDWDFTGPIRMRAISCDDDAAADFSCASYRRRVETFFRRHALKRKDVVAKVDRISRDPDSFIGP